MSIFDLLPWVVSALLALGWWAKRRALRQRNDYVRGVEKNLDRSQATMLRQYQHIRTLKAQNKDLRKAWLTRQPPVRWILYRASTEN